MSSPELETLDQLLGGEQSLQAIRPLYPDDQRFLKGLSRLVSSGDLRLLTSEGAEVPAWQWHTLFVKGSLLLELDRFRLKLTVRGARKIS